MKDCYDEDMEDLRNGFGGEPPSRVSCFVIMGYLALEWVYEKTVERAVNLGRKSKSRLCERLNL